MVEQKIRELVAAAVAKPDSDPAKSLDFAVERPNQPEHGDFSTNAALVVAKERGVKPRDLADELAAKLSQDKLFESVEVAGPGFINFRVATDVLSQAAVEAATPAFGRSQSGQSHTVVIEYSGPNVAKRFTVGHLRSTIIGQALCNLHREAGWRVEATNHFGDWGTQFGKMIVAIDKWADKPAKELKIEELEVLYVKFHREAEGDASLDDAARATFKRLEDGDAAVRKVWRQLLKNSMQEFDRLYDLLGAQIEHQLGESDYEEMLPEVIAEAEQQGLAKESEGALIVPFPNDELPPAMLRKSDGATTYFTRDLAAIKYRRQRWHPDRFVYEVGADQSLHFQQVFHAAELLGWGKRDQFVHVPHGLVRLPEGKMSTRKGRAVKLEPVLAEAVARAGKLNDDPRIAQSVGIGAVKYNDLKRAPKTGYTFSWEEMITFEGDSGPYLQYVHTRCRSVLKKAGNPGKAVTVSELEPVERALLLQLEDFPVVIQRAVDTCGPQQMAGYLFELAQRFNRFYEHCPIVQAETTKRSFRVALTAATANVMKRGLSLLGIAAPEKM